MTPMNLFNLYLDTPDYFDYVECRYTKEDCTYKDLKAQLTPGIQAVLPGVQSNVEKNLFNPNLDTPDSFDYVECRYTKEDCTYKGLKVELAPGIQAVLPGVQSNAEKKPLIYYYIYREADLCVNECCQQSNKDNDLN